MGKKWDEGRVVPPHYSGPSERCVQRPRIPFHYDPDETAGRKVYRARAEQEAAWSLNRGRVKMKPEARAALATPQQEKK